MKANKDPIVVIGMGCVYPGAHSPEELWQNVLAGRRYFRNAPDERLPKKDYFDSNKYAPGKTYCDKMAVITDWEFDPLEFRIPPISVYTSDIAHWLALYTAREAIKNSGLNLDEIDRTKIGVIIGNTLTGEFSRSHNLMFRWPYVERSIRRALSGSSEPYVDSVVEMVGKVYKAPLPEITEDSLPGNMSNTIAGRICNTFDLGGGCYTVDGACSSSLLSIAHACSALLDGEMDIAVAGGVDISLDPFEVIGFAKTTALSADDIRPYDEHAEGLLPGEGCGIVLLTRESFAKKIGAEIHAVIPGWGYSSDGSAGITAPEAEGQMRALKKAYDRAGYSISDVQLIEGHGTGTTLGDKVEVSAIMQLLEQDNKDSVCRIGSIKSNIGHCKAAAGVAAFIKAVMALKNKIIPPTTNCEKPNASFGAPLSKLVPAFTGTAWGKGGSPRRASVSAMGFGGANSHITIEEVNPNAKPKKEELELLRSARKTELILLSAKSEKQLIEKIELILPMIDKICRAELTDLSSELAKKKPDGKIRLAVVTNSPWDLHEKLLQILSELKENGDIDKCDDSGNGIFAAKAKKNPKFFALFPGQGSQRINMCRELISAFPFLENIYDEAGKNIREIIFHDTFMADDETIKSWENNLKQTGNSQPAIVLSSLAIQKTLSFFGLKPDTSIGHSLGEIAALASAGAYDEKTAVKIAIARGKAMASSKNDAPGGMIAVAANAEKVEKLLSDYSGKLNIANYNSPVQTVVTGALDSIDEFAKECKKQKVRCVKLPVSNAFHSEFVRDAADELRKELDKFDFKEKLSGKVISTSTGEKISPKTNLKNLLAEQITASVKFISAIEIAKDEKPDFWVEVGPGGVLTGLTRSILGRGNVECFPTDLKNDDPLTLLNNILARAFSIGLPVATEKLFEYRFSRPISIENYNPIFIVNPCERPIEISAEEMVVQEKSLPGNILPDIDDASKLENYLAERGEFIKQFIELDFRHFTGEEVKSKPSVKTPKNNSKKVDGDKTDLNITEFAIDWIVQRTGFPKSSVSPEMKLRDDLNLDSIKVGELVFMICKKLNRKAPADPSAFANARLDKLISLIQTDFKVEKDENEPSDEDSSHTQSDVAGIDDWVGTFQIEKMNMPLSAETFLPFPKIGSALIIGEKNDPRVIASQNRFERKGLNPVTVSPDKISELKNSPLDFSVLVLILPEENKNIFDFQEKNFDDQLYKNSLTLFNVFRWIGNERDASWKHLRCLVARPCVNPEKVDDSADAGKAFMKTLRLEHSALQAKWLTLPTEWSPDQWANVIEKEILTTGSRVFYKYDSSGTRVTDVAKKLTISKKNAPELNKNDVLLATGGAKGITFEMSRGLALKTGVKLMFIGRSALPGNDEMVEHFKILDDEGIVYKYFQCDVTNLQQMKKVIDEAEKSLGKITAVLHGAGISKLTLLENMSEEDFLKTINIKARGMYNLVQSIPMNQLKVFHVISSVLGKTGMRGQTDYTFANAWLDGALAEIKSQNPKIHCASLGYSVWAEAGLGQKLGVVKSLKASGVNPMSTKQGVDAYLKICSGSADTTTFIVTGSLGSQLENDIFAPLPTPRPRFTNKILRYAPGVELISEISVDRDSDLFIAEHVFEGTTMFPGVMAIEAMAEAAAICLETDKISEAKNIDFIKPIIIPENDSAVLRIYALAVDDNSVKCVIRVEADGFQTDCVSAEFIYDKKVDLPDDIPAFVDIKENIDIDPDALFPSPLFQGKFFRRISKIKKRELLDECVTEIIIPENEKYFDDKFSKKIITASPAARDSFLQSGLLILPEGSLPEKIGEIIFCNKPVKGEKVICRVIVKKQESDQIISDLAVYNEKGKLIEIIKNVVTKTPDKKNSALISRVAKPIPLKRVKEDLDVLAADIKWEIAAVSHSEIKTGVVEISDEEIKKLTENISDARHKSVICNLAAARRAALAFAEKYGKEINSQLISLQHDESGKPQLVINAEKEIKNIFDGCDVSITDSSNFSFAFIGQIPVGIDVDPVESRDAETWRGLLHNDGYKLALNLTEQTMETFDVSATRVWTLIEAAKKANDLKRILPRFNVSLGDPWLSFSYADAKGTQEYFCTMVSLADEKVSRVALTISFGNTQAVNSKISSDSPMDRFNYLIEDFSEKMTQFKPLFADDPNTPDTEEHHKQFCAVVDNLINQLIIIGEKVEPEKLYQMRTELINHITPFLDGSDVFRHAIEKPFGYAGDFLMLDKLVQETSQSRGLAFHFDKSQLEYPASVACRNRIKWVAEDIVNIMKPLKKDTIKIFDIGIGAAPIERCLVKLLPETKIELVAVDIEPAALEYVEKELENTNSEVKTYRIDLRRDDAAEKIAKFAAEADVCIAVGIIEALRDEEVINVLGSILKNAKPGTPFYTESFNPQHPTRPHMEWFMDFHLGYRTAEQVKKLVIQAGAKPKNMKSSMDATHSLDFLKVII